MTWPVWTAVGCLFVWAVGYLTGRADGRHRETQMLRDLAAFIACTVRADALLKSLSKEQMTALTENVTVLLAVHSLQKATRTLTGSDEPFEEAMTDEGDHLPGR